MDSIKKANPDLILLLIKELENEKIDHQSFLITLQQIAIQCFDDKSQNRFKIDIGIVANRLHECCEDVEDPEYGAAIRDVLKLTHNLRPTELEIEEALGIVLKSQKMEIKEFLLDLNSKFDPKKNSAMPKIQLVFPSSFFNDPRGELSSIARIKDLLIHDSFIYKENRNLKTLAGANDVHIKEETKIITRKLFANIINHGLEKSSSIDLKNVSSKLTLTAIPKGYTPEWLVNLQTDNKNEVENSLSLDLVRGSHTALIFQSLDDAVVAATGNNTPSMIYHIFNSLSLLNNSDLLPHVIFAGK